MLSKDSRREEKIFLEKPYNSKTKQVIEPAHTFEVSLEPDNFTEEKYQLQVEEERNSRQQKLGSYHQCYRLDGRLIAIGVLDLLPECVSSVYFIYHEDVQDWKLGKLGVLHEIALAIEGGYRHYYMGKLLYPLMYPETYSWDLFNDDFVKRLSARKYVSMKQERQLDLPAGPLTDSEEAEMELDKREALHEYQSEADPPVKVALASVFENRMPGVLSVEEVRRTIDLDQWRVEFGGDEIVRLKNLVFWERKDVAGPGTLKNSIVQFAAALGPSLVRQLVLDLS
ncbi:MAG: hypothetical protein LQ351_001796 [Letrouitia transgressa]|nr:MAG: hypothetical protein LQ351_001796 [Letrouitia transgressa]